MRSRRAVVAALTLSAAALVPISTARAEESGATTTTDTSTGGGEFVVSLAGDTDAAVAAIEATGAEVYDVNAPLGVALVGSDDGAFLADAEAAGAITAGARNQSVGTERQGMPHKVADERAERGGHHGKGGGKPHPGMSDPLASYQWDMQMMGVPTTQQRATGKGVTVGIIDTGVDASQPDIAPNFTRSLSRNFVVDIPDIDGPCEVTTCVDPVDADDGGHGTHVAGPVAAARNGIGITGVAPDATIVNVRAGQDSGYFFLFPTLQALTYTGDARLDVVNMSFYVDPWLYNCASIDDYVSGDVTDEQNAEQAFIREMMLKATAYAHDHGVTLVAAAGNGSDRPRDRRASRRHQPGLPAGRRDRAKWSPRTASTCRPRRRT